MTDSYTCHRFHPSSPRGHQSHSSALRPGSASPCRSSGPGRLHRPHELCRVTLWRWMNVMLKVEKEDRRAENEGGKVKMTRVAIGTQSQYAGVIISATI